MTAIQEFGRSEHGQDLTEWALLIALVLLGTVALFSQTGSSTSKIWVAAGNAFQDAAPATPADSNPVTTPPNRHHHGGGDVD